MTTFEKNRTNNSHLRIVIAEAEPLMACEIKRDLEDSGHFVTGMFISGEEIIKNIEELETDLIVMDVLLNGAFNGVEAAGKIMLTHNLPVIFIMAPESEIKAPWAGYMENCGVLFKPFSRHDLLNIIESVYAKFVKSISFYRDCRNLILQINPYKINFVRKVDCLVDLLASGDGKYDLKEALSLLSALKDDMELFANPERLSLHANRQFRRSLHSMIGYTDYLLNEMDSLDADTIKKYISCISINLKILLENQGGENTRG